MREAKAIISSFAAAHQTQFEIMPELKTRARKRKAETKKNDCENISVLVRDCCSEDEQKKQAAEGKFLVK